MSDAPQPPTTPRTELAARLSLAPRALPEDTRRSNRSLILRALHHGGPASRADLAKLIGVTAATASSVIKDLHDAGLVEELGRTSGSVGKPATMVGIDPDGRHIGTIGLSEPDRFVGALVDLSGKVVERRTYEREERTGTDAVELVQSILDELVDIANRPILGVGIASPGIVDTEGTVVRAARLGWHHVPLAHQLGPAHVPVVHVANDANASALAELTFGSSNATNFVLVRVDQGVGAGLVLNGELFTGAAAAAGEIGHVVVQPDGDECTCGKRGCLETKISAPLLQQIHHGDDDLEVIRDAGAHLGAALASTLSALDVADVVLSGPSQVATETFRDAVHGAVAERTLPELGERLVVRPSSVGDDDIVLGAAALVLDRELGIR